MKQFLYIIFLGVVLAGCSDNQVTAEEESKKNVKRAKPAEDGPSNTIESGIDDIDADTIGMAEFLALKASVAAKYRQAKGLTDENEENEDTTGFTAFKRSKATNAAKPCDCDDSTITKSKKDNNSRNSRTSTKDKSKQETESTDEVDSADHAQVVEGSSPVSRKSKSKVKENLVEQ